MTTQALPEHARRAPTVEPALARALRRFASRHPRWAASLFDEHFVRRRAAPLLRDRAAAGLPTTPADLAAAWLAQLHWPGATRRTELGGLLAVAADFLTMLDEELGGRPAASAAQTEAATADELGHVLAVYAEALRDGSNWALDWLWLAERLPLASDRRYCLGRALQIDPGSELALAALARLDREQPLERRR